MGFWAKSFQAFENTTPDWLLVLPWPIWSRSISCLKNVCLKPRSYYNSSGLWGHWTSIQEKIQEPLCWFFKVKPTVVDQKHLTQFLKQVGSGFTCGRDSSTDTLIETSITSSESSEQPPPKSSLSHKVVLDAEGKIAPYVDFTDFFVAVQTAKDNGVIAADVKYWSLTLLTKFDVVSNRMWTLIKM